METLPAAIQSFLEIVELEADGYAEVTINNDDEMKSVANLLRMIKTRASELNSKRLEITRPIDESKARVMGLFRPIEEKLKNAEAIIKRGMLTYEAKIAEENKKLQEEANRLAKEAEERRKAAIVRDAEQAIEQGKPELAVAYIEKAEAVVVAPINVAKERRAEGIATMKVWRFEILDISKIPSEFLIVDEKKLQKYATAMRETAKVEGVRFFEESVRRYIHCRWWIYRKLSGFIKRR